MGFYDNYNFDGLHFFSGIKRHANVSEPCKEFLSVIEQLKSITPPHTISL